MNHNRNLYIPAFMATGSLMLAAMTACQDDPLFDDGAMHFDSDMVLFQASVGAPAAVESRAADDSTEGLPPLTITDEEAPTLYLHRYVCDNSFDPAETPEVPASRGAQITRVDDFAKKYGAFWIKAETDPGDIYINQTTTEQIEGTSGDNIRWRTANGRTSYWPGNTKELTFFAWAPTEINESLKGLRATNDTIQFSYAAEHGAAGEDNDAVSQRDLLLALDRTSKSANSGTALLTFTHPLSAIKFKVRDLVGCTVTGISIENVISAGKCTFVREAPEGRSRYTWDLTGKEPDGSFSQKFNVKVDDYETSATKRDVDITATNPEATFMMIPQAFTPQSKAEIVIRLKLDSGKEMTLRAPIYDTQVTEWLPGKEYVYTISTSGLRWTYVFNVKGSYQKPFDKNLVANGHRPRPDEQDYYPLADNDDKIELNHTVEDGYYTVESYRYLTNNPTTKEPVTWNVKYTQGTNHLPAIFQPYATCVSASTDPVEASRWVTTTPPDGSDWTQTDGPSTGTFTASPSSTDAEKYNLKFFTQYIATDYANDWWLRQDDRNGPSTPEDAQDLSGGAQNTANCYLVNKSGWYKLPLVYGNALKNGKDNPSAYEFTPAPGLDRFTVTRPEDEPDQKSITYTAIKQFPDYKGDPITQPWINGADTAILVWEDAKGIIDQVKLIGNKYLAFHVEKMNLMQGNAVVAAVDGKGDIMWSWHIWVTDYCQWANPNEDKGPRLGAEFPEDKAVVCDIWDHSADYDLCEKEYEHGFHEWKDPETNAIPEIPLKDKKFTIAPVNLGWCDPKNVGYIERSGTFEFTQVYGDGEIPEQQLTHTLSVKQRGHIDNYWIGNNTYYKYGRKDPAAGFMNVGKDKITYGNYPWEAVVKAFDTDNGANLAKGLAETIRFPYQDKSIYLVMFGFHFDTGIQNIYNLWNNYADPQMVTPKEGGDPNDEDYTSHVIEYWAMQPVLGHKYTYSAVKTVYDPSPAGFVVPPFKFFDIFTKGRSFNMAHSQEGREYFNGTYSIITDPENYNGGHVYYKMVANTTPDGTGTDKVFFTTTGQRWGTMQTTSQLVYVTGNSLVFRVQARRALVMGVNEIQEAQTIGFLMSSAWRASLDNSLAVRCVKEFETPPIDSGVVGQ